MKDLFVRRLANFICLAAFLAGGLVACQRKNEAGTASSPTPTASTVTSLAAAPTSNTLVSTPPIAPAITGSVTPALVNQNPDSITRFLHYPRDPEASKMDAAVQFFCEITENGEVESTHALVGNNDAFNEAVQTALDWGRFTPATVNGKAVREYLGGTVLFLHENGEEVIVISLATFDRDRVGKMQNYIQPQLVGGLRHTLEKVISGLTKGILVAGTRGSNRQCRREGNCYRHHRDLRKSKRQRPRELARQRGQAGAVHAGLRKWQASRRRDQCRRRLHPVLSAPVAPEARQPA